MHVAQSLNELKHDPISALLGPALSDKYSWIIVEWQRTHKLTFTDLPNRVVNQPDWSAERVQHVHTFCAGMERDYVVAHVGDAGKSFCIKRDLAEQLQSLL